MASGVGKTHEAVLVRFTASPVAQVQLATHNFVFVVFIFVSFLQSSGFVNDHSASAK